MTNSYLSIREVANALDVSEWTVRQWCLAGKVPGAKKFGNRWRIPAAYLGDPGQPTLPGLEHLAPEVDYDPRDEWARDYEEGVQ